MLTYVNKSDSPSLFLPQTQQVLQLQKRWNIDIVA